MKRKGLAMCVALCLWLSLPAAEASLVEGAVFADGNAAYEETHPIDAKGAQLKAVNLETPKLIGIQRPSNQDNLLVMAWQAVPGAQGYRIYRREAGQGWKYLAQTDATVFQDTTGVSGTLYAYTVRAYVKEGAKTILSGYDKTGLRGTPLLGRIPLAGSLYRTPTQAYVQWIPSKNADGYYIYRKVPGGRWSRVGQVRAKDLQSGTGEFIDKSCAAGRDYVYTVRGYVTAGKGNVLGQYDSTGVRVNYVIPNIANLKVSSVSKKGITISWGKTQMAKGYRIYRRTGGGKFTALKNTSSNTFTDTDVVSGKTYEYWVRGYMKGADRVRWGMSYNYSQPDLYKTVKAAAK